MFWRFCSDTARRMPRLSANRCWPAQDRASVEVLDLRRSGAQSFECVKETKDLSGVLACGEMYAFGFVHNVDAQIVAGASTALPP